MRKVFVVCVSLLVFASLAFAQGKVDTKWHCNKATTQQKLEVGDQPDHSYVIAQGTCTATAGTAGDKTGAFTEFQEVSKSSYTNHGRFNVTKDNGDMTYYTYQGSGSLTKKAAANKWSIVGGTGKQKSAKGSGACSGKLNDDGSSDWVCNGASSAAKGATSSPASK